MSGTRQSPAVDTRALLRIAATLCRAAQRPRLRRRGEDYHESMGANDRAPRKRRSTWLYGCGLGCALIVLAGAVLVGFGAFHLFRMIKGLDDSIAAAQEQDERFGPPASFVPRPDGAIPGERMEAFLEVRDALAAPRAALVETFERMPPKRDEEIEAMAFSEKVAFILGFGRAAMGLGPEVGRFFSDRDRAMLDAGIGRGEYAYIYTVACYSWLGHDPTDAPRTDPRHESEGRSDEFGVQARRVMSRVRLDLIQNLRNQLASLPESSPATWRATLEAEIDAMERDETRSPWQGAIPEAIAESLAPYRERLEASYHPAANPFELSRTMKTRRWSYRTE